MLVRFLVNGESPDVGAFSIGDERDIPKDHAEAFISRGIASSAAPSTTARKTKADKEE